MDDSSNLKIPFIMAAQAQKHVTHNEAIRALDVLVQLSVIDRDLGTPPVSPSEGDRYLVAGPAQVDWAGYENDIAVWQDGNWSFHTPNNGWILWVADEEKLMVWDSSQWVEITSPSSGGNLETTPKLGINSNADSLNRLTAKSDAVLLSHDDITPGSGDVRLKINKSQEMGTASILLQNNYSSRAEIGLTTDDNLHFKVSADGSNWHEAMVIDGEGGRVAFPNSALIENFSLNVLGDCGRFHANITGASAGAFVKPAYLDTYNGSTFVEHGKFIHNNNDFGGASGFMNTQVKELIQQIKNPAYSQYGCEFYVARITSGAGVNKAISFEGSNFYLSLIPKLVQRYVSATVHFYLRAVSGSVLVPGSANQRIYVDGDLQPSHAVLSASQGWKSIRIEDEIDPHDTFGYSPSHFALYQSGTGSQALLSCLALIPGIVNVDPNAGVLMNMNAWES